MAEKVKEESRKKDDPVGVGELQQSAYGLYRDVERADGFVRLEYYHDAFAKQPIAFRNFEKRLDYLPREAADGWWKTVVVDSLTYMEIAARKEQQYNLNPSVKDRRQWWGGSTDSVEEILLVRFAGLACNCVTSAHVSRTSDMLHGEVIQTPSAPGRLSTSLGSGFSEVYRPYIQRDEQGREVRLLQTQAGDRFTAQSQIEAPNPCYPAYPYLWQNWRLEHIPLHALVYCDYGGGKSTFAATWPKPMLVLMFDPMGKDLPYHKPYHYPIV